MDIVPSVRIRLGASLLHDAGGSIVAEGAVTEAVLAEEAAQQETSVDDAAYGSALEEEQNAGDTLTFSVGDENTDALASDADLVLDELDSALLSHPARNGLLVFAVAAVLLCLFFFRHQLLSLLRKRE